MLKPGITELKLHKYVIPKLYNDGFTMHEVDKIKAAIAGFMHGGDKIFAPDRVTQEELESLIKHMKENKGGYGMSLSQIDKFNGAMKKYLD